MLNSRLHQFVREAGAPFAAGPGDVAQASAAANWISARALPQPTLSALLAFLIVMYLRSDPSTHLGASFGNAIADWLGVLVFVIATKYFFEAGSGESRKPVSHFHRRAARFLLEHSLTLVLMLTGAAWIVLYAKS